MTSFMPSLTGCGQQQHRKLKQREGKESTSLKDGQDKVDPLLCNYCEWPQCYSKYVPLSGSHWTTPGTVSSAFSGNKPRENCCRRRSQ